MFVEEEENKGWKHYYICAMIIVFFNLGIIIVCRVLLDSENEFDEPVITGDTREKLQFFLLYFSVTFCFGCCGCFCCLGKCCGWIGSCLRCCKWSFSDSMTQSLRRPAAEALRQQHERIDAARAKRPSIAPIRTNIAPQRPIDLSFPVTPIRTREYSNFGFNGKEDNV